MNMEHRCTTTTERQRTLLEGFGSDSKLVEVGASFRPLAPKSQGWQTWVVDHDTRENLIAKYGNAPVDTDEIEKVDVLWQTGPLHEAFPKEVLGTFDAVVASHVMEHMPDLIGFLDSCRQLVHPRGALVFALPDKRWCFDFFRPVSLAGDALLARHEKRSKHSAAVLFNEIAYSMTLAGRPGWTAGEPACELVFAHEPEKATRIFNEIIGGDQMYRDAHAWQFTPSSFELMLLDLARAGACDWHVEFLRSEPTVEFLGRLRPGVPQFASPDQLQDRRKSLLFALAAETLQQMQTIVPGQDGNGCG